ncbi:hypothetical protein Tco_0672480 [Tanacetum coccineum]
MNKKSYSFDLDTFRNMLQICPKLPGQHFVDTPFEEDILAFMRELGYSGTIKLLSDVKVDLLPQPWRTFATIINKCLSGKVTGIDTLRLSRAQILWGLYHQENVDFVYLLWEDLVYQIENKESRKNKYLYYPRFTKVIINHFMSQDQSIPRRNKVDWHMANDDPILTTMRFIPQHEVVQKYGAILPNYLITPAMKESEAFKTYYAFATGKVTPKPKYVCQTSKDKTEQAPKASTGKRLKAAAKGAKSGKKRQHARRLETLSEVALTKAEQLRIVTKRSLIQTHSSHASSSGAHEGTDDDDDNEGDDDATNDDHDDADNQSERTKSDNEGDEFVYLKFTTQDEEEKEEESSDPRVHTPSQSEPSDNEANVDVAQSKYTEEEEGRDADMTDAPQTTQVIEDTHVTLTLVNLEGHQQSSSVSSGFISNMLNPNLDRGINSILNTESTSLVEIPVTYVADTTPSFDTTLPPPPLPLIQQRTQTPLPIPTTAPSTSLQDLPNFGSKLKEAVDVAVQLKSDRIREEAQAENEDFFNKVDENMMKIIKEKVNAQVKKKIDKILPRIEKLVNEQLEFEVLIRSSNEAKTSHIVAANLSKLELKKILIDKMKKPSAGLDRGSRRRRAGKEPKSSSAPREKTSTTTGKSTEGSKSHQQSAGQSAPAEVPMYTTDDFEDLTHQEFDTGLNDDQPEEEAHPHPDWQEDSRESFNELMDPPFDFLSFMMNRLKVDTLTPELLAGPTFELMKSTCKSLVELKYFFEEVYKATTEQLNWTNPEGQRYPHDLRKPLPLIPNSRGRQVIPFAHFINNDLAYLSGKLTNLKVEERLAFSVALRMFTRSIVIQRRVEDLQLGVETYLNPRGFIYQNRDQKNRLMRLDELYKFSDGTLNDVRTALDDRLKGIQIEYLPQTIWRNSNKERATAMIQKIDKMLKSRRIMRSLERFDTSAGNPIKEILLKLNLPDHRILKDGGEAVKDRPPMLGPGRYSQWRSRFLWYIDTKPNGEGLRKSILSGPTFHLIILFQAVDASEANEMWIAIERLQHGESLNVQNVKTNLFWEFRKFTSRDGESMESNFSRMFKILTVVCQANKEIDTISYHTLFDILKQYQNEVNDIRAERIAKSANPLALLAAAQPYSNNYYQAPKPQRSMQTTSSTRP